MPGIYSIMNGTHFIILFVPIPVGETNCQGQVIYDSITVETSNTQDSTPPPEDEEGANSSYSEATDEDNLVIEGGDEDILDEGDDEDNEMMED